ncbi:MEF2-activating motif and SAP domain-containing transcriptional regulator isoform X1 [Sciurus carolinensis]|uniref:MEF2-activating motif and SAP domain-containing transcriptional regulator isoform X1 n=2 Tax=Sciurus carolinensis TaxID=30640 RepID=UPI001FB4729E|nr:MEF2-activating motif and SAP domain-containing transcriptional regulator isoform X1 [Sciurus carolinensis]XP_047384090.1 MEF2-activating motif and SAP domain-containing transcriptional regulator isoform X1 [Sciurus carolinensis]
MTLAASSQRSQIIRSKFRSVLQLRIHRRNQDPTSDSDPWISASGPALAPALPSVPASFLFSPGVLLPETEYCTWRSPKKESPKISQRWSESKPRGNLTYHQYMPPEPRQGSRADPQVERSALGPQGPPLWEGTNSQQLHPRMKPTPLTPFQPGVPSPSPPPHKLELQTLKLEELTVSELRQQLRLRGLPVSGTKSMLLERMRGGAPPRERQKPRREDGAAGAPWPRLRSKTLGTSRRQGTVKSNPATLKPSLPRAAESFVTAPAPPPPPPPTTALTPSLAPLTLEEELQEAIRRAQLLPNRGIDDILEDQMEPEDPLPPIPLDFPGSFDVLSPSPDSEGLSSVFSSSLPTPTNSPSTSPRGPTDSLDWLEALSGGPPLGSGPPAPSIFSADLSDSSGTRLWDLLEDPW